MPLPSIVFFFQDFIDARLFNICVPKSTFCDTIKQAKKGAIFLCQNKKQRVYDALNKLGIKYEVVEHEPVHTMEDMDRLGLPEKGTLCKNLFLRDAKGKRHFLITCDENAKVDLKSLGRQLGAGNLSFASEERLEKYLGLKQGSVSPFGLMNDTDHAVEFFY